MFFGLGGNKALQNCGWIAAPRPVDARLTATAATGQIADLDPDSHQEQLAPPM
jgi:hypothetical protein